MVLAVHDDARYVGAAVDSVLQQSLADLELIVVDDASSDETPRVLGSVTDSRLRVLRNDERQGLAASLNRGLDESHARYLARLDADDVALPQRLAQQVEAIRSTGAAVVGSAVRDLDERDGQGRLHGMPTGARAVRWHALFSSPFFHPTVLVDRQALGELRYDTSFLESEDYDLWTRLLATGAEGGNLPDALVLKRVHAGQASRRRGELQRSFQRRVALREIERIAPDVDAGAAWSFAVGRSRDANAYRALLAAFESKHGVDPEVRRAAARRLARAGRIVSALKVSR